MGIPWGTVKLPLNTYLVVWLVIQDSNLASRIQSPLSYRKLLNKLTVTQLAELSNLSKPYISQVKSGKRPPSERLLQSLYEFHLNTKRGRKEAAGQDAVELFLGSRRDGLSPGTVDFYRGYLLKSVPVLGLAPSPNIVNAFLGSLRCSPGGKHAYYRALSVFYNWIYSPHSGFGFENRRNPITWVEAPKKPRAILPSLSREQATLLINRADSTRDKAIIALFTESGLRLSELLHIKPTDIDWEAHTVRVIGKGNKEGYAPFGDLAGHYLKAWLAEYKPMQNQRIWDIGQAGVRTMLDNLRQETGLPCNPHTFRRTFACLLRKAGVDSLTIKDLGRWESLEMVQRYTRSVTFEDSLKHYKAPLS
jgi:site-specific recombinase XerD/transcriptional regulator with XRE-family HTH domain